MTRKLANANRDALIFHEVMSGASCGKVAKDYELTPSRIRQIVARKWRQYQKSLGNKTYWLCPPLSDMRKEYSE